MKHMKMLKMDGENTSKIQLKEKRKGSPKKMKAPVSKIDLNELDNTITTTASQSQSLKD